MVIEIDEGHLAKATKCKKSFACLVNPSDTCCEIVRVLLDQVYYVRYMHGYLCSYVVSSEELAACTCPIRKEIYRLYNM